MKKYNLLLVCLGLMAVIFLLVGCDRKSENTAVESNFAKNEDAGKDNFRTEVSEQYGGKIEGDIQYADLNNDGKEEAVLQYVIGANGAELQILGMKNNQLTTLFTQQTRAGTLKIENNTVILESSIIGEGRVVKLTVKWDKNSGWVSNNE